MSWRRCWIWGRLPCSSCSRSSRTGAWFFFFSFGLRATSQKAKAAPGVFDFHPLLCLHPPLTYISLFFTGRSVGVWNWLAFVKISHAEAEECTKRASLILLSSTSRQFFLCYPQVSPSSWAFHLCKSLSASHHFLSCFPLSLPQLCCWTFDVRLLDDGP